MSKKRNTNNINEDIEKVEVVEETTETIENTEEITADVNEEEKVAETPVESVKTDTIDIVKPSVKNDTKTEEIDSKQINKTENGYYVSMGVVPKHRVENVTNRLARVKFTPIVKNNNTIVGPFNTKAEALAARKVIVSNGVVGRIVKL